MKQQAEELVINKYVRFLGPRPPDELKSILSAAYMFALPSSSEGWANVLLEAKARGLPIVTTDVGGNKDVVYKSELGIIVPSGNSEKLLNAVDGH